jgi:hypothetical protein
MEPAMDVWNRGNVMVKGTTFDLNGVYDLLISMDNGVSFQRADFVSSQEKPTEWNISLNTKAYADGIYSMLIRTTDKYGVYAYASGIINIDNSPPEIDLGSPANGDRVGVVLPVTGQIYDNINLSNVSIELANVDNPNLRRLYELPNDFVVMESLDVSAFPDGDYTVKVVAVDQSGNEATVIRNVNIVKARAASEVALINPLPGITHTGPVVVSGRITGAVVPETVTLKLNREDYTSVPVNRYGIFRHDLPESAIEMDEPVIFSASFLSPGGERIESFESWVQVSHYGPILTIDSHHDGDIITRRPWISGRAFYIPPPPKDRSEYEDDESWAEGENDRITLYKDGPPKLAVVDLSFDDGRSFSEARIDQGEWRFRLETGELDPGPLPIVIRAIFYGGRMAVRRIILTVDTRAPVVHTIGPAENSSYREAVMVYGSAGDDFDMDTIEVSLRPGDKNLYEVPGFIQGLYFDGNALGGLNYMMGMGLTFFDDNVKVQVNAAQAAEGSRYSGWAFGFKILANVYTKNLSEWFGPDWEFYTTSLTVGAHFSYFLMEEGETPLWMGQLLGQWEMIKADMAFFFPKWKYFKTFSIYTEPGIWFAPSDVVSAQAWRTKFTIAFGGRISLF